MSRRLLRKIAHYNMERKGLTRINKQVYDENGNKYSLFSGFWKDYIPKKGAKQ